MSGFDERLIHGLLHSDAYPHPVAQPITRLETHISVVLLTGTWAYKLKKPVDLGFVDFTTLARREHFCHEELRLNSRLAGDIYVAVVPVTGSVESPQLNGVGTPIEYAVQMRQFDQSQLLTVAIKTGELQPRHIDRLAHEIAGFHQQIAVASAETPFGTPAWVHAPVAENFEHFEGVLAAVSDTERTAIEELQRWTEREFQQNHERFVQRKQRGFIRECHGDIHLGNMILAADRIVVFDCIEFNDQFRWIDVLSEVAFLVMDLIDRGSPLLAARFLNEYLSQTGDYVGLHSFRYFLVYRACVRAKVAAIRCTQDRTAADGSSFNYRLLAEFLQYVQLAESLAHRPNGNIVLMHGVSGSGKSTVAAHVAVELGAVRLRSDSERLRLAAVMSPAATDGDYMSPAAIAARYCADMTEQVYRHLVNCAQQVSLAGFPVVVDATFLKREQRDMFRELARSLGVECVTVSCTATDNVLRQRVAARLAAGRDPSEATVDVLDGQLKSRQPLTDDEAATTVFLNTETGVIETSVRSQWGDAVQEVLAQHADSFL